MGGFGWQNGFPVELGGAPADAERIYHALRRAMGERGTGPEGGIEDLWRQCEATVIAAATRAVEAAAMQAIPGEQTYSLDDWEEILGIAPAPTDPERQAAVAAALTGRGGATLPELQGAVTKLDAGLEVDPQAFATARVAELGIAFGSRLGTPPFGSGQTAAVASARYPNFSDGFVVRVWSEAPVPTDELLDALATEMNTTLPAWVDWDVYAGELGFFLDGGPNDDSLLDLTAFD